MMNISVVIPVYGVEKYIEQLLCSVKAQTLENVEFIFVDDGSPDKCPEILDQYALEDKRCKVIHQKNGGVSVARNTGLSYATGKYVYIADSDDWLEEGALQALWEEAERTNADLIYGDYYTEEDGVSTRRSPFEHAFVTDNQDSIKALQCAVNVGGMKINCKTEDFNSIQWIGGAPWRVLIRRALLDENNIRFDPYVRGLGDDILFSLHVYEHVKRVAYVQSPIYHYRILNVSYSHGYKKNLLENYDLIFERMEKFLTDYKKDQNQWNAYYARIWIYFGEAVRRYFLNTNNLDPEDARFNEFKKTLNTAPYKTAIQKLPLGLFAARKTKLQILMLRIGLYKAFWMYKKSKMQ